MSAFHVDDERPGGITLPCPHGCPGAPDVHKFSCPWHGERGARLPAVKLPDGSVHVLSDGQSPTTPVGIPRDDERGFPHPAPLVVSAPYWVDDEGVTTYVHHYAMSRCVACREPFHADELTQIHGHGSWCWECVIAERDAEAAS